MNTYSLKGLSLPALVLSSLLLTLVPSKSPAQTPTVQDCLGAIPICNFIYVEENSYYGSGNYPNEIFNQMGDCTNDCPGSCLDGEQNSVWYVFTVQDSGDLRMTIEPLYETDDYDWAVYDITELSCEDIYTQSDSMQKSCNAWGSSGINGSTGISTANGGTANCNHCGDDAGTSKWNLDLPVSEGSTYVLIVENWGIPLGGYTLDFSASTAVIFDDQRPRLGSINVELLECDGAEIEVVFSEYMICVSVNPSDFTLTGPGGPYQITEIHSDACMVGAPREKRFLLEVDPPLTVSGNYSLQLDPLSFVTDACYNFALGNTVDFTVDFAGPGINESGIQVTGAHPGVNDGQITGLLATGAEPMEFLWTNAQCDSAGASLDLLNVPAGTYTLFVTDAQNCTVSFGPWQVWLIEEVSPDFSASPVEGEEPLLVKFTDLSEGSPLSWKWDFENDGIFDAFEQNPSRTYSPGIYSIKLVVANPTGSDSLIREDYVTVISVPEICNVSVTTDNYNRVVWEKAPAENVASYTVYRETTQNNVYEEAGTVLYADSGLFADLASNPRQRSYKYRISAKTPAGYETTVSDYHRTIHLSISQGTSGWNLNWNPYEGFLYDTYYIYRGPAAGSLSLIDSLSSSFNSYSDLNPPAGQLFYAVEIVREDGCDPLRDSDYSRVRSNIRENGASGTGELLAGNIDILFDPSNGTLNIRMNEGQLDSETRLTVFDLSGKTVFSAPLLSPSQTVHVQGLQKGMYIVRLDLRQTSIAKKLIIN